MNEQTVFTAAIERDSADRPAFLDEACGTDQQLRVRVEKLIELHENAGSFLERLAAGAGPTVELLVEQPGMQVGPYKLLQSIGEGGMGVVYMAEQLEPVRRMVALKVIKPGMESRQVIARFEAERQALAMMDHVNIARVFDAGTTEAGQPYFVMELVRGVPITQYCDDNQLTPRQRLELFVPVCQAIQHAHLKGIIHRDIKPSNVMITLYDGQPVPKVIDFGVAKATEQKLTERTLFTQYGTLVGTLEYMSPEQAEMSALGVDTRSDIYSLGVLLYELLTGSTPLSRKQMQEAAYAEILRMIKEEEPPKPSTRLSESGEALASISAQRQTEPAKLSKLMRGELDWIVMKTLEKDRNRRYETASGFAADVQRYLNDEPVQACPPSAWYRFRKFARRNQIALAMAGLVLFFLVLLGCGAGWAVRDRDAREAELTRERTERQARVSGQVELILDEADRWQQEQNWPEALAAARWAEALISGVEADSEVERQVRRCLDDLRMVQRLEEIQLRRLQLTEGSRGFDYEATGLEYAAAFRHYGIDIERQPVDESARLIRSHPGIAIALTAALDDWTDCRKHLDDTAGAKRLTSVSQAADLDPWRHRVRAGVSQNDWETLAGLATSIDVEDLPSPTLLLLYAGLQAGERQDLGLELLLRAQQAQTDDFWINFNLAQGYGEMVPPGWDEAVRFYSVALALRPESAVVRNNLGIVLHEAGRVDEAVNVYQQAIVLDPGYVKAHSNLGNALRVLGRLDEAMAASKRAVDLDPEFAPAHTNLGNALLEMRRVDEAVAAYRRAIELDPKLVQPHIGLGNAHRDEGRVDEAIEDYQRAVELDPKKALAQSNLGNVLYDKARMDEAIAAYQRAIDLDPGYARAHTGLGNALRAKGLVVEAITAHRQAIVLDPKLAMAHENLGKALRAKGLVDEAIASYRRAIDLAPENALTPYNLGIVLSAAGRMDEAIASYQLAIALNSKFVEAYINLGVALRETGRLDEAIEAYRRAIDLAPKFALARIHLGIALADDGQWEGAIAAHSEVIELTPRSPLPLNNVAWLLATCPDVEFRDPVRAVELARLAVELGPKESYCWNTLGVAHYRAGDWQEAVTALVTSSDLSDGGSGHDWFFLAMAHRQLGNGDEADSWYDKAVAWTVRYQSQDEELHLLRVEAATLLGRADDPSPP